MKNQIRSVEERGGQLVSQVASLFTRVRSRDNEERVMERRIVLNLCGAVYTMNADGTGLARLTNHGAADAFPTWSPDGGRIGREPWVIACSARRGRLVKATTMPGHLARIIHEGSSRGKKRC